MSGQILPDRGPITVNEVEYPLRHAGLIHDLGKNDAADGCDLAGFENHRAARGNCRRHFAYDLIERPIPRSDQAHHTNGLANDATGASTVRELEVRERFDRGLE